MSARKEGKHSPEGKRPGKEDPPVFRLKHEQKPKRDSDTKREEFLSSGDLGLEDEIKKGGRKLKVVKSQYRGKDGSSSRIPLRNPSHNLALVNLTHTGHRPSHRYPGFRILGLFPTEESLRKHQARHFPPPNNASFYQIPVHQLMVICRNAGMQADRDFNNAQINKLVKIYADSAQRRDEEFSKNVEKRSMGSTGTSLYRDKVRLVELLQKKASEEDKKEASKNDGLADAHFLPESAALHGQKFAAIIVLSDLQPASLSGEKPPEPCIAILGVFGSEEEASEYAKNTASQQYPKTDIDVVEMYRWVFPENVHPDKLKDEYADEKLNKIMLARKENQENAACYEKFCAENGYQPSSEGKIAVAN